MAAPATREEEPELIVRIYDLSDLLAMVTPYPAMVASDLDAAEVPLFPSPTGTASGPSGVSGMGGMGGAMSVPRSTRKSAGDARADAGHRRSSRSPPAARRRAKRTKGAASSMNAVRIDLDALIDAITSTIEPPSWNDVGGPGSIAPLGQFADRLRRSEERTIRSPPCWTPSESAGARCGPSRCRPIGSG